MHYVQFDDKITQATRRQADKFCLVREVLDKFILNCRLTYHPTAMLTVDEQLLTTKSRCPFTEYMPKKTGKFDIKFWVLANVERPYGLNMKPYLDKQYDGN